MADPGPWPPGTGRHVLATCGSTNAEALRLAPSLTGPAWVMARRQTAGRGRRGRAWIAPPGNLAATLIWPAPPGAPAQVALWSFVAALAVADALAALAGPAVAGRITLKWPNDVLLDGGKVAGILLESGGTGGRVDAVAVGVGINLIAAPPPEALEPGAVPAIALAPATGATVLPDAALDALAPAFASWQARLASEGFAPIRAAWLARAARLGQPLTARLGAETVAGRFDGIDGSGALLLATAAGPRAITAAEIAFGGAA